MKIIPAILAKSFDEFQSMVKKIEPYTDLVHLDIADGKFVPNKTIDGYEELEKIDTKLNFEVHLMVNEPEKVVSNWLSSRAIRYLVHREAVSNFDSLIGKINMAGREVGLVFNPKTDYSGIEPYVDRINLFQFMTVDPGFYGSPFLPEVLEKIRDFHLRYPGKPVQVDGGVHSDTIKMIIKSGVNSAVLGSHIFSEGRDIGEVLKELETSNV